MTSPDEIEKAAEDYAIKTQKVLNTRIHPDFVQAWGPIAGAFLAGARWQRERDEEKLRDLIRITHWVESKHKDELIGLQATESLSKYRGEKG